MHDLCILIALIEGDGVEAAYYVAAVDVAVAEYKGMCICGLGHDSWSKIWDGCRYYREIGSLNTEVYKTLLWVKLKYCGVIYSSCFCGNCHPITLMPGEDQFIGGFYELLKPDPASQNILKHMIAVLLCLLLLFHGTKFSEHQGHAYFSP